MIVSLLTSMFDVVRFVSGFTAKNASIEHLNWSYIQRRGKNETDTDVVVFLHGFSSSKESWLRVARGIDKRYKIVIPDLPGQGRTTPIDILADYSMPSQAKRLHDFLEKEVPADKKIHLVGCSMGGMLAGVYAGLYPKRVKSLTMVFEDLDEMNKYLSYEPPKISKLVLNILASEREKQLPVLQKIIRDSLENPTVLEDLLPAIRARMLVMWGKHDQVLDVSSVDVLKKKWSPEAQGQVVLFDDCGHILHHEKYVECTAAINKFLSDCEKV
ncbi:putative alpha/beta hydrolase-1 [Plasmopara halstedii]